jgi:hypothetical protein
MKQMKIVAMLLCGISGPAYCFQQCIVYVRMRVRTVYEGERAAVSINK